jgi:hypothetical protein
MIEKKFHIYLNNECLYHSLNIEDFEIKWKMISEFLTIIDDRKKDNLSYEEVLYSKETILNSSH